MSQALSALFAVVLAMQGPAPLRKSDLVRLLSGAVMSPVELAEMVRRTCLTFQPTDRDRNDFRLLGADASLLAAVDDCGRRKAPRRTAVTPVRTTHRSPSAPSPPPPPPPPIPAAQPPVFQVQRVLLPRALVFEARDSAGAVLSAQAVTFTGINARIKPGAAATDAAGQARVGVTLGERVGSATVIASIGVVEKQVAFSVAAGPAAQLAVMCGTASVAGHFVIRPDSVIVLRVSAQDGYANPTPLLGLRAAVADARIFRVLGVSQDSAVGTVTLKPDQPGTTSLAVIANGMRQYLTVTVPPRAAPGKVDCR